MKKFNNMKNLKPYEIFEFGKECFNKKNYELSLKAFNESRKYKEFYENSIFEIIKIYFECKQYRKVVLYSNKSIKVFKNKDLKNNIKIILAKLYKIIKKEEKALKILDSIKDKSIRKKEYFVWERLDISFLIFNRNFRVSEFSGNVKNLKKEFSKIKNLPPQNKAQLFYISRVSNFLHNYNFTKKLINKYKKKFDYIDAFYDNAILNEFEIATKKIILKSKPRSMWIATSSKCNVYCKMCDAHKVKWELSNKNIKDIYKHMPYLESIVWWGGEPTISDLFYKMLNYSLQFKNIKHVVVTNGQYMPQKFLDIVSENKIEVVVSIDSVNKKMYEKLRKGASFDRLKKNLSNLSKILNGDLMKINMVAMKNNVTEIKEMIKFAKKFNIKNLVFIPLSGSNFVEEKIEKSDIKLLNKQISKVDGVKIFNTTPIIQKEIPIIQKEIKILNKNITDKNKCALRFCHVPWTDFTFMYSGAIMPDNICGFFGNKVSSIKDYDIDGYWNSSPIKILRRKIIEKGCCNINCSKANVKKI